jgi:hypothetical protein
MSVLTTAPEVKVNLVTGGREMGDLFSTHAPKSLAEGYRFYCLRKTKDWHTVVFEFSQLHEYEMSTTIRNCSKTVVFRVSRVDYENDPETCWLIEWDSYGMSYRIQFYCNSFIDMDTEKSG